MMNNDKVSEVYKGELWPGTSPVLRERIHWICRQAEGASVLDVGCSQGITSILLAREGFQVTGLDVESPAIEYAQADRLKEHPWVQERLRFVHGDIFDSDLDLGTFDTVILGEIIEHVLNPEVLIRCAFKCLLPRGRLILTTPFGLMPFHDHRTTFNLSNFLQALPAGLQLVYLDVWQRYIRCTGTKAEADSPAWPTSELLAMTEKGLRDSEERYQKQIDQLSERIRQLQIADNQSASAGKAPQSLAQPERATQQAQEMSRAEMKSCCEQLSPNTVSGRAAAVKHEPTRMQETAPAATPPGIEREVISRPDLISVASSGEQALPSEMSKLQRSYTEVPTLPAGREKQRETFRATEDALFKKLKRQEFLREMEMLKKLRYKARITEKVTSADSLLRVDEGDWTRVEWQSKAPMLLRAQNDLLSRTDKSLTKLVLAARKPTGLQKPDPETAITVKSGCTYRLSIRSAIPSGSVYLRWMGYDEKARVQQLKVPLKDGCTSFDIRPAQGTTTFALALDLIGTARFRVVSIRVKTLAPKDNPLASSNVPTIHRTAPLPPEHPSEFEDGRRLYNLLGAVSHTDEKRVLLYANVNTNAIDGSSVWLINVAKMLSCRYRVDLLLKANITTRHLLSELESDRNIRVLSPDAFPLHMQHFGDSYYLDDFSAAELMTKLDMQHNYRFVLCRGKFVNYYLSINPRLNLKLIAYFLIDYYKQDNYSLETEASMLRNIVFNAACVLTQTDLLRKFMLTLFGGHEQNYVLLPPMVGNHLPHQTSFVNKNNVCLYAGKFDLDWRIDDILNLFAASGSRLRLIGSKFHQQKVGEETLRDFVLRMTKSFPHIEYLGVVDHQDVHKQIDAADFGISVRVERYLASKEFSTKVLEFGARGKPTIVNDSAINRSFLGCDYPLFANTNEEIAHCLEKVKKPSIYSMAAQRCYDAARQCSRHKCVDICDHIEASLQSEAAEHRIAVLSDSKEYLQAYNGGQKATARITKVLLCEAESLNPEPLLRLLRWAEIIELHVEKAPNPAIVNLLKDAGKMVACTGAFLPDFQKAVRCNPDWADLGILTNRLDVSVIVPCKDLSPQMIERALRSVINQNKLQELKWELIVVDDQSAKPVQNELPPDLSTHPQITFLRHTQKGLGLSRNIGFEHSRGQYVFFLDGDDYYSADFIAQICSKLEDADVVFSTMIVHREHGPTFEDKNYVNSAIAALCTSAGRNSEQVITATSACVKGYRRTAIEITRLFFGRGYHEDIFPWMKAIVEHQELRISFAASATYYRTVRAGSAQITENSEIVEKRKSDLEQARRAVLAMLVENNKTGLYDGLVSKYRMLLSTK